MTQTKESPNQESVCTKSGSQRQVQCVEIWDYDKDATICDGFDSCWMIEWKEAAQEGGDAIMGSKRVGNGFVSTQGRQGQRSSDLRRARCGTAVWPVPVSLIGRVGMTEWQIKVGSGCQGCVHFPNRTCKTWPDDHVFLILLGGSQS